MASKMIVKFKIRKIFKIRLSQILKSCMKKL